MSEQVTLRVTTLERSGDRLTLGYELRNAGAKAIWVLNRLYQTEPAGHFRLDPDKVYVQAEGTDTLILAKALHPVPKQIGVEFPEVPCVTRLEPGGVLRETISLRLPLEEAFPYRYGMPPKPIDTAALKRVRLRVGYVPDAPEIQFHQGEDTEGREYRFPRYPDAKGRQVVVDSGPLPFPAAGKKR